MKINNPRSKVYRHKGKMKVRIEFEIKHEDGEERYDKIEYIRGRLEDNMTWMPYHLVNFGTWDYSYNIHLFADSLIETGRHILKHNILLHSKHHGGRAMTAGYLLKQAYELGGYDRQDKSYDNHFQRSDIFYKRRKVGGMYQLLPKYKFDNAMGMEREEYENKMYKVISKRRDKVEKEQKESVWKYIHRYIENFWD